MASKAVRLDADEDIIELTSPLPTTAFPITIAGWVRLHDVSGDEYHDVMGLGRYIEGVDDFRFAMAWLGYVEPPNYGLIWSTTDGNYRDRSNWSSGSPPTGDWVYCVLRCTGSSSGNLTCAFWNGSSWSTVTSNATMSDFSPTAFGIYGARQDIAFLRMWSANLSNTQLQAEAVSPQAVVTSNLVFDWPLQSATDETDLSGNDRAPTLTALTTVDDGPSAVSVPSGSTTTSVAISFAATGTVTIAKKVLKLLQNTAAGSPGLQRLVRKSPLANSATGAPGGARLIRKGAFASSATGAASFSSAAVLGKAFSVAVAGTTSLAAQAAIGVSVVAAATGTVSLAKRVGKFFSLGATGSATRVVKVSKNLAATATGVAAVAKKVGLAFSVAVTGVVSAAAANVLSVARSFGATGTVTATRKFIEGTGEVLRHMFAPLWRKLTVPLSRRLSVENSSSA